MKTFFFRSSGRWWTAL